MSQYSRYMFRRPAQHASFCPAAGARAPRYRTFAERLGRRNAKSILLHYFSVIVLSYIVWTAREIVYKYSLKCE